jgi:hypothetical protein
MLFTTRCTYSTDIRLYLGALMKTSRPRVTGKSCISATSLLLQNRVSELPPPDIGGFDTSPRTVECAGAQRASQWPPSRAACKAIDRTRLPAGTSQAQVAVQQPLFEGSRQGKQPSSTPPVRSTTSTTKASCISAPPIAAASTASCTPSCRETPGGRTSH